LGDEYCDVLGYAAAGLGAGKQKDLQPLNFNDCTFLPGEGHITLLVSKEKSGQQTYAILHDIQIRKSVDEINHTISDEPVIINAAGKLDQGKTLSKLKQNRINSYTGLYGGMPIGGAFNLAVACVSLKDRKLYPMPGSQDKEKVLDNTIICLEYCRDDEFNIYRLE